MKHYENLCLQDIRYFCEFDLVWKVEQWKDVIGYENIYKVSDLGRVKSVVNGINRRNKIIKSGGNRYVVVGLYKNKKKTTIAVHKLVAIAFLNHTPCGMDLVVNHKDFNILNNTYNNLEITTQRENTNKKHLKHRSKFTGVRFDKYFKKWAASIYVKNKLTYFELFESENKAHLAYENKLATLV